MARLILILSLIIGFVSTQHSYRTTTTKEPRVIVDTKFAETYDEALDAIFSIALRVEALLSDTKLKTSKNFLVSPLSMAVAVGEVMLGARGSFEEQLHDLLIIDRTNHSRSSSVRHIKNNNISHQSLHEQLGDLMKNLQNQGNDDGSYTLKTASVLFAQRDINIKDEYRRLVEYYYGTRTQIVDFQRDPYGTQKTVNDWVQRSTNNLIKELYPTPFPRQTSAILANAVYFKADWEVPFASEINKRGVFKTSLHETVNVTYMIGEFDNYRYIENKVLGCRMVVMPYLMNEVKMYIIMPTPNQGAEYDINAFVQKIRNRDLNNMIDNTRERKVTMVLPKMSLSNIISMIEPLKRYHSFKNEQNRTANNIDNIETVEEKVRLFNNRMSSAPIQRNINFDLGNISEDPRFRMNNIFQQMTLNVNEKGTEAAVISAGIVDYILDSVVFRVDRPFLFFIRHENTKAPLFWGTIVDPTEERAF